MHYHIQTEPVNETAYMEFKSATDALFAGVSHDDLARILGVSVATIRQARLRPDAKARRSPPEKWEEGVIRLAGERIERYRRLISELTAERQTAAFGSSRQ